jgi:hypothetical protein
MPLPNPSRDSVDLTEKQLKFADWYVKHKTLLRKVLIGFLIALGVIFWGYGLYGLVNYYFIEGPKFSEALKELSRPIDFEAARLRLQPKSLEAGSVSVLSAGKEKYDLLVKIFNSNPDWYLEFDYNFVADGERSPQRKGFVLPEEEKFLLGLGTEARTKPRQTGLEINNLKWQRIDAHKIPNYASWRDERLNFVFENVKFLPAVIRDSITVSRASFVVKNLTAYGFWDVGLNILLYRGSSVAAVNYVTLEEFISGQNRPVEVSWFDSLPPITEVKVAPEVNIFDEGVYMPVE